MQMTATLDSEAPFAEGSVHVFVISVDAQPPTVIASPINTGTFAKPLLHPFVVMIRPPDLSADVQEPGLYLR
jgi:hypothetical protein